MKEQLIKKFKDVFSGNNEQIRVFFAPGRVNLIGEHTDYNGGYVFPCALTIGTYAVARKRADKKLHFYSENFSHLGIIETDLDQLIWSEEAGWTNYPKGVIWTFQKKGYKIEEGFDVFLYGNIPNSSGLSSSASVELVTGILLKSMYGFLDLEMTELALIGQYAENNFNKVNCGIMDQFVIAMGKKDYAILLDTNTLQYEYAQIKLENAKIIIANTNKKRGLGDSKYNQRRAECEEALRDLQKKLSIESLCEMDEKIFEENKSLIQREVCIKRARHAVYENQRTLMAVKFLKEGRLDLFGSLMNESHLSLKKDYEVSGLELDTLVEAAWKQEGLIGARMTGAGFGGCTVNIVESNFVEKFVEMVGKEYQKKVGIKAEFYIVEIGDGAREI